MLGMLLCVGMTITNDSYMSPSIIYLLNSGWIKFANMSDIMNNKTLPYI